MSVDSQISFRYDRGSESSMAASYNYAGLWLFARLF